MSCREYEADVVDLARGAGMSAAAAERLGAHLEQCADCAARFARARQLTTALKAVAADVPASTRSAAIEARLLTAFAERHAEESRQTPASRPLFAVPAVWGWLAAAAVVVLAVAVWQGAARWRPGSPATPVSAQQAAASPAAPAQTTAGAAVGTGDHGLAANTANAATPEIATRAAPRPAAAPGKPAMRPARTREDEVLRFVTLPTAIGLPAIESGRIVRVDVPTAMLAAYGLEVAPDSQSGMVEADVLVGQDGQPRAIRFVTLDSDSRRRQ